MVGPPTPRTLLAPNLSRREQLLALITCSGGALACPRGGPRDPEQTLDHDGEHLSRLSQLGANPSGHSPGSGDEPLALGPPVASREGLAGHPNPS